MTNFQFLQTYVELQKDIMFDELFELPFATICYCKNDPSPFWNNALINSTLDSTQIHETEKKLAELKRKPAFYFEHREELHPFVELLQTQGYSKEGEDSLMFHNGQDIDSSRFHSVKKVENEQDLEVYLQTFNACYHKDDPLNPYGELGEYLQATRIVWNKHHKSNRIEYFTAFKNEAPVAVAALTNYKGIGYISNIGSILDVRGQGYGKLATMYCVLQSKKNGNTEHCLATEEGTNPNSFYKSLGFTTRFNALLLVKK